MIDVILYGQDLYGRLTLRERCFSGLRELSSFLSSPKAARWQWAEVQVSEDPNSAGTVRYSADALRAMVLTSSLSPSAN